MSINIADTIREAAQKIEGERRRVYGLKMTFDCTRGVQADRIELCQTAIDNLLDEANRVERWTA